MKLFFILTSFFILETAFSFNDMGEPRGYYGRHHMGCYGPGNSSDFYGNRVPQDPKWYEDRIQVHQEKIKALQERMKEIEQSKKES